MLGVNHLVFLQTRLESQVGRRAQSGGMIPHPHREKGPRQKGLIDSAMYGRTWSTYWNPSDDGLESRRISK